MIWTDPEVTVEARRLSRLRSMAGWLGPDRFNLHQLVLDHVCGTRTRFTKQLTLPVPKGCGGAAVAVDLGGVPELIKVERTPDMLHAYLSRNWDLPTFIVEQHSVRTWCPVCAEWLADLDYLGEHLRRHTNVRRVKDLLSLPYAPEEHLVRRDFVLENGPGKIMRCSTRPGTVYEEACAFCPGILEFVQERLHFTVPPDWNGEAVRNWNGKPAKAGDTCATHLGCIALELA